MRHASEIETPAKFSDYEELVFAVMVTDAEQTQAGFRVVYVNAAFEAMTGWSRDEIIGRSPAVLQGTKTDHRVLSDLRVTLAEGRSWTGETVNYRRNGTPFIMRWSISPIRHANGRIRNFIAIQEDVTEARNAARQTEYQRDLIMQLMNAASEGMIITNSAFEIVGFGAGAEKIFGWREIEVFGAPIDKLIPERFRDGHKKRMEAFRESDEEARLMSERTDALALHKNGFEFPVRIAISRTQPHEGQNGFVAIVHDRTAEKAALDNIKESERRFRSLFALSFQFLSLLSPSGVMLEVNDSALSFVKASRAQCCGVCFLDTPWFDGNPDARADAAAALEKAQAGRDYHGKIELRSADGALHYFDFSLRPIFDDEGDVEFIIAEAHDITESRAAEEALLISHRKAHAANEAKSRFLATIGHELRTPLNAINGFSELIENEILGPLGTEKYKEYISDILSNGRHMSRLIESILEATKAERGSITLNESWHCMKIIIKSSLELSQWHSSSPDIDVNFHLNIIDETFCFVDSSILRQCIINLAGNALKFSPSGTTVTIEAANNFDGSYSITVRDEGPGIPSEMIDKVTLPFVQADDGLARKHGGIGLGLYLTRSFIERHQGRLDLKTAAKGGTEAILTLPAARCSTAPPAEV